jgi:hypothetical protein
VVDLVQVLHDQAAVADGQPRDTARYLTTWVRNQNPRLRTLAPAGDARVDLLGGARPPGRPSVTLPGRRRGTLAGGSATLGGGVPGASWVRARPWR